MTEREAPLAPKEPRTIELFGDVVTDEYAWMRNRDDPRTMAYLEAENAYTEAVMKQTGDLRDVLFQEFKGRLKEDDQTVPYRKGPFWYYSRTEMDRAYRIYGRRRSLEGPEEIILDVNALAEGHDYVDLGVMAVSPDHRWLAYSVDYEGDEIFTLYFLDLETREHSWETIEGTYSSLAWANDSRTIFYDLLDAAHRPNRIKRHVVGEDPAQDVLVFQEADERFFVSASRLRSQRFVAISLDSAITSEVHLLDADDPTGEFQCVAPRRQGVEYDLEHQGDRLLLLSNEGAVNFRLFEIPIDDWGRDQWRVLLPHREDVQLESVDAFADHFIVGEREGGLPHLRVLGGSGADQRIPIGEPVYDLWLGVNAEYDTQEVRYGFDSLVTPPSVIAFDLEEQRHTVLKRRAVPTYDAANYVAERLSALAPDGTEVPISLVRRRDRTGSRLLLNAYGAYGDSFEPDFNSAWVSLLDRGFAVAIAHVRGGGELGRRWKLDGKLAKKRNTFADFIACAETLIEKGYTTSDSLAISGGSAGGLLIGAVLNQRPELFCAAVASVPFVDVINTMLDDSLPLTAIEREEWGDPNVEADYRTMRAYSPYENVRAQRYPHLLIRAGLNDPRVGYWEGAKYAARMRASASGDETLLLETNMGSGHMGASDRYEALRESAFEYAFVVAHVG